VAANRVACANNLRMLGIASLLYHDAVGYLPSERYPTATSLYQTLLPYVEGDQAADTTRVFLCPTRRGQCGPKRDFGYAASSVAVGQTLLGGRMPVSLGMGMVRRSTGSLLLLSHLWLAPRHYQHGDPTDLGWATLNNSRAIANTAKADTDATGSTAHIGGPYRTGVPSLFLDAHVAVVPYDYPYWAQLWAWDVLEPPELPR